MYLSVWFIGSLAAQFSQAIPGLRSIVLYPYGFYFVAGAFLFLIRNRGFTWWRLICLVVCFGLTLLHVANEAPNFLFTVTRSDVIVAQIVVTLFFVVFALSCIVDVSRFLPTYFVSAAALTYPLYLIHNRAGKLLFDTLVGHTGKFAALAVSIAASVSVAALIVTLVDRRLSKYVDSQLQRLPLLRKRSAASSVRSADIAPVAD
jgi:hypothetical protein